MSDVFDPIAPGPSGEEPQQADIRTEARKQIIAGALWYGGGILVSILSYWFAEVGGRYYITTGLIVWGLIQLAKGLSTLVRIDWQAGNKSRVYRTLGITTICLALTAGASIYSYLRASGPGGDYLESPQHCSIPQLGLSFDIPEGYAALEEKTTPETEEDYARYSFTTYNDMLSIQVDGIIGLYAETGAQSVEEVIGQLQESNATFFDDEILNPGEIVTVGGIPMFRSAGICSDEPQYTRTTYEFINKGSLITVYFSYDNDEHGKPDTESAISEALGGLKTI